MNRFHWLCVLFKGDDGTIKRDSHGDILTKIMFSSPISLLNDIWLTALENKVVQHQQQQKQKHNTSINNFRFIYEMFNFQ